jgi:hypothetical protein
MPARSVTSNVDALQRVEHSCHRLRRFGERLSQLGWHLQVQPESTGPELADAARLFPSMMIEVSNLLGTLAELDEQADRVLPRSEARSERG